MPVTEAERLRNALGLAMKAGKVVSGALPVDKALAGAKVKLLILDQAASENSLRQYAAKAASGGIPLIRMLDAGGAVGKPERMVLALTDENFTKMILQAHDRLNAGGAVPGVDADGRKEF